MIYIEDVLNQAICLVKDNINDELTKIDVERAGETNPITMKPIDTENGIVFQSLNNLPVNFDPILYYGVDQVETDPIESAQGETWSMEFSIILSDPQDRTAEKRVLRYQRALKSIFLNNYIKLNNMRQKVRVRSLNPVAFTLPNASIEFRAIGILVETTLFQ